MNQNQSQEIKANVTIAKYLALLGIDYNKIGEKTYNAARCPICQHKDCFRFSDTELYKCFSCDNGGDVIELYQVINNCDFGVAVTELANAFNIDVKPNHINKNHKKAQASPILQVAVDYYMQVAMTCPAFKNYIRKRQYTPETMAAFKIGYADGKLHLNIKKRFSEKAMLESGLVRKNKRGHWYDLFKNQIIFPFQDQEGNITHIKGKGVTGAGDSSGRVYQLKLPEGVARPVFGSHLKQSNDKPLCVCEGETDCMAVFQTGRNTIAFGGTPSQEQLKIIGTALDRGRKVFLVFDNDDGGQKYVDLICKRYFEYTLPKSLLHLINLKGRLVRVEIDSQYKDIDDALRHNRFKDVTTIKPLYPPLKRCIEYYEKICVEAEMKYSADFVSKIAYDYFSGEGRFFVVDEDCYLLLDKQYLIDNNMPFKALMYAAGINYANQSSKKIWEGIKAQAYLYSPHTDHATWIHTDHEQNKIHYNLCNENNELARIIPGKVKVVSNGYNNDNVFLLRSPKTMPIEYLPDTDIETGMQNLINIFTTMATPMRWQLYIIGLVLNSFILEFAKARGVNKFTGHQGSGKTDAAGLVTSLLYGKNFVTISSTASDYTDAALNPITICDNLEISNIDEDRKNFLLCVATGITRQKRQTGTDTKNIYEKATTQIITTSIESFEIPELIERAIIVPFSSDNFQNNHPGSVVIENKLIKQRNVILSACFKLIAEVLKDFERKKTHYTQWLQRFYPHHSKKRLNEHLACVAVTMDAFLNYCPNAKTYYNEPEQLLSEWIAEQDNENEEVMLETNIIVRYLNMVATEFERDAKCLESDYGLTTLNYDYSEKLQFEASTDILLTVFYLLGKKYNFKPPFKSVRHLAVRIRNEKQIIEKAGWEITLSRKVRGKRIFLFTQTV